MSVRVRFAPSPTGALHIGGVRTALFNYLFARQQKGTFVLRIEDTDQTRFVAGAEQYIVDALKWLGISPDEGPEEGGDFAPYRQSERKGMYRAYAEKLLTEGKAYYAFDTPQELDAMRERLKEARVANPVYNAATRMQMKNSLTLSEEETQRLIQEATPYVVRIKLPRNEEVRFQDKVRGWVVVNTATLDDKVLLKSDGMPTYHLANIVDDHLMEITHVIRGEEWLPSAPLHIMLYKYFGWEPPTFAHLPLLLKPDGNGKLSKRAADKMGFPIFPLEWKDPESGEIAIGFKEEGYLPEALINFLALLGWNPGGEKELFSLTSLIKSFSLEKINKAGAKFDIEKAKWFNQQYLKFVPDEKLKDEFLSITPHKLSDEMALAIVKALRERITFIEDFVDLSKPFFYAPEGYDEKMVRKKWNDEAVDKLQAFSKAIELKEELTAEQAKELFSEVCATDNTPFGKVMPALRLALTGGSGGPDLMEMVAIMGSKEALARINTAIQNINN